MIRLLAFLASVFSINASLAQTPDLISPRGLVGIWQVSPEIAAGWNDSYLIYPDGKIIFAYNQMDLFKRLLRREGTWTLDGAALTVVYTRERVTIGGKVNKNAADGENGIEGGKDVWRKLAKPVSSRFTLSGIGKPQKNRFGGAGAWSVLFDTKRFYKIKDDPKEYEN